MWQLALKVLISALVVVAVSEIAKRSTFWAAALASLPLTSLLAFVWLYLDTHDTQRVATISMGVFWLVLPSLLMFVVLSALLRHGMGFWTSLGASCVVTGIAYIGMTWILGRLGVQI